MAIGRPTDFNDEVAATICAEIASGRSLRSICEDEGMPAAGTVYRWVSIHDVFREQYARAQQDRTVAWSEELVEISDDLTGDTNRDKLRVDTRKWLMSKMAPKKYGDKIETVHSGSIDVMTKEQRDAAVAAAALANS